MRIKTIVIAPVVLGHVVEPYFKNLEHRHALLQLYSLCPILEGGYPRFMSIAQLLRRSLSPRRITNWIADNRGRNAGELRQVIQCRRQQSGRSDFETVSNVVDA